MPDMTYVSFRQTVSKALFHCKAGDRHPIDHFRVAFYFAPDKDDDLFTVACELGHLSDSEWIAFLEGIAHYGMNLGRLEAVPC